MEGIESLNCSFSLFLSLAAPFYSHSLLLPGLKLSVWQPHIKFLYPEHSPASYARGLLPVGEVAPPFACFELGLC